jgi:hypothetical protein
MVSSLCNSWSTTAAVTLTTGMSGLILWSCGLGLSLTLKLQAFIEPESLLTTSIGIKVDCQRRVDALLSFFSSQKKQSLNIAMPWLASIVLRGSPSPLNNGAEELFFFFFLLSSFFFLFFLLSSCPTPKSENVKWH